MLATVAGRGRSDTQIYYPPARSLALSFHRRHEQLAKLQQRQHFNVVSDIRATSLKMEIVQSGGGGVRFISFRGRKINATVLHSFSPLTFFAALWPFLSIPISFYCPSSLLQFLLRLPISAAVSLSVRGPKRQRRISAARARSKILAHIWVVYLPCFAIHLGMYSMT